ncbi:DUF2937 family protein [Endozoicomonas sp. SCSIO W0465]|uniref:DUF2937 family protein n=1 Tax=Endozoicomonas sp. SCSIO W0465 TaxID=2918516 RepID=UPI002074CBBB|nr:DUF2937 family protein [Endozoicomonas sp. SCSIO W0465]USE38346.1 DUF2937 family protein [Endozoicomonas sp. SCSIO W0465]
MIVNLLDKLLFGGLMLIAMQVPVVSDHYVQYLSGYYEATRHQVEGFRNTAARHGYPDEFGMINDLLQNPNALIKDDARQKQQTLQDYKELTQSLATLINGNYFERAWFISSPKQWRTLEKVLENFKPGIPLSINDLVYSVLTALLLSTLLTLPLKMRAFSSARA